MKFFRIIFIFLFTISIAVIGWMYLNTDIFVSKNEILPEAIPYTKINTKQEALVDDEEPLDVALVNEVIEKLETRTDNFVADESSAVENQQPISNNQLPETLNLAIPFQSQAPHANWELPYQEACEEASLIMADRFFSGLPLTPNIMDEEIKKVVAWEKQTFGYFEDTTVSEVARIAREFFSLSATIETDVTVDAIKQALTEQKVVIVPAAGQHLPNPYFSGEGPLYHMLVIRGYTQTHFITNDPGTRRGEEFLYAYDDLLDVVHDWPFATGGNTDGVTDADIRTGNKVMLIIDK